MSTTTDSAFCPGSKLAFVPVLEPGQGFRDKSLDAFVPGWQNRDKRCLTLKFFFAHHGIRSHDLLPSAWFPYQLI